MKIEKLVIYGFGKHDNMTVDLGSGMNVLYGLNEAGKTTIQQFMLHVLFGFPQRNSVVLRYEPKSGGKYGGQVQLMDERYGRCTVERIRGKSAGDVTVHFEDGKKGGEEALNLLLRQYDRASFESIFSFSLLQLQGFEKMAEEELSRTLLASGTTGVDSLLQLERQMEKEMGELFKKSGRNPEMNVKIKELRELEFELKEEQGKVAEYAPSIARIHEIDECLAKLREEEKESREQLYRLSSLQQLLPLHRKQEVLETRLAELKAVHFPSDGIRRFESLDGKLKEAQATKLRIESEREEIEKHLPIREQSERLTEIEQLLEKESGWHEWRSALVILEDDLSRLDGLKQRLLDRLGIRAEEGEAVLFSADVSIRKEEEMHELIGEITDLTNDIRFGESRLATIESELTGAREKFESMAVPSAEEMEHALKWPKIRQQLAEAKAYVAFHKNETKQASQVLPIAMLLAAFVFVGFGFIQQQWVSIGIGLIIGGIGAYLYPKKASDNDSKRKEMEQVIATYEGREAEKEQLIVRIESYKREKERLEEAVTALERNSDTVQTTIEHLTSRSRQTENLFDKFLAQYGFDGLPSPGIVPELFRMIREVHEVVRNREEAAGRKEVIQIRIAKRMAKMENALQQAASPEAIYELLRSEFRRLNEEAEKAKRTERSMEQLGAALKESATLVSSLRDDLRALLEEANAESEEAFYSTYDIAQEKAQLKEQVKDVNLQLATAGVLRAQKSMTDSELVQKMTELETRLATLVEEANHFMNEKAMLANKAEQLLASKTAGRTLQLFEMKKAELAELAKKWAARKAVAEAIRRMMNELKEKKLPEVLGHAQRLFSKLTAGKYGALKMTEEGYFEAVGAEGMRYPIVELSQATKEQAYISLRLALAASVLETAPFPIIMDDPLVHFDEERLSRMIEVLDGLTGHQIIYFTCHKRMKNQWPDAKIINVSEIGNEQGASTG